MTSAGLRWRLISFVVGSTYSCIKPEATLFFRTQTPTGNTVSVPTHKPLKVGTLLGIVRVIAMHKGVSKDNVLRDL